MIPLYGFLQGDTVGLLVLVYEHDLVLTIAEKLKSAASVRVAPRLGGDVWFDGKILRPGMRIADSGLTPLDRVDVRFRAET